MFHTQQVGWGLRGDPVLWRRMTDHFADQGIPSDKTAFQDALTDAFAAITGIALGDAPDTLSVPHLRRAQGGMSNGIVSAQTWRAHLIPLLLARHRQSQGASDLSAPPVHKWNAAPYRDGS